MRNDPTPTGLFLRTSPALVSRLDAIARAAGVSRHRAALCALELGAERLEEHPEALRPAAVEAPASSPAAPQRPRRPSRQGERAAAPAAERDAVLRRLVAFLAARGGGLKAAARAAKVSPSVLYEWRAGTRGNITGEVLARVVAWIDREEQR